MSYIVPFQDIALFENTFRHQINKKSGKVEDRAFVFNAHFGDGENDLPVEADRYRLIWMPGCPHSNKAVITARLLGLDRVISIGECGILRDPRGWVFSEDIGEVDPVLKVHYLDDAYLKSDPSFTGRSTVPAIADITTGGIVQNEAWDIPRYFVLDWEKYHKENAPDLYPEDIRAQIDETIEYVKVNVNAYACGFARDQEHYEKGYKMFHDALDNLDERLSKTRFLDGDYLTLSDIHLFVALIRFYLNYHLIFGVNKKRLEDYPNLWDYTKEIYQIEAFYDYTKIEWIKKHYQLSPHMRAKLGNVNGLVGVGPDDRELLKPVLRKNLSKNPENIFIIKTNASDDIELYKHENADTEKEYLKKYVIEPIEKAGDATFQTELERWANILKDSVTQIDLRLEKQQYLLGENVSDADVLLYQTLLRLDYIYYYQYKLNKFKSYDFENISKYIKRLEAYDDIKNSIDIEKEKEIFYKELSDRKNPYHLVYSGPEINY